VDTAHYKSYGISFGDNIYTTIIYSAEKVADDIVFTGEKYGFTTLYNLSNPVVQSIPTALGVILRKIRKAYIFDCYTPDPEFIVRINKDIATTKKLKERLKPCNCLKEPTFPMTYGIQRQLQKIEGMYLRLKEIAEKFVDITNTNSVYAKNWWPEKSVLVGTLRNTKQLSTAIKHNFYHIPKKLVSNPQKIKCVAIYQSKNLFKNNSGIKYYGKVTSYSETTRRKIKEIPSESDEIYIRFEIEEWKSLKHDVKADYLGDSCIFTTLFQLMNCEMASELLISDRDEFNLYEFMRETASSQLMAVFSFKENCVMYTGNFFEIFNKEKLILKIPEDRFLKGGVSVVKLISASCSDQT